MDALRAIFFIKKKDKAMDLLIVYVHGFLGSENSFEDFPNLLKSKLSSKYSVESKAFPTFKTAGSNHLQVMALVDWLLLNATTSQYKNVILIAHSMGGLLVCDAFRYLFSHEISEDITIQQDKLSARHLVNIIGIFTFDSPYYGLHPSLTTSSMRNAKDAIANFSISQSLSYLTIDKVPGLMHESNEGKTTLNLTKYAAVGTAAIAALSYLPIAVSMFSMIGIAQSWAVSRVEDVRHHLHFLQPLATSKVEMHQRMLSILSAHSSNGVYFCAFQLKVLKILDPNLF